MKKLLVHFAVDRNGGEFRRINRLAHDVDTKFNIDTYEVIFIPIHNVSLISTLKQSKIGKSLFVFPVILPFRRYAISRYCTYFIIECILRILQLCISPNIIWAETLNGYRAIRRLRGYKILDFHGDASEETIFSSNNMKMSEEQTRFELESLSNCSSLILQSDTMLRHLESKYNIIISHKSIIYNCGVDTELFNYMNVDRSLVRSEIGYGDDDIIFIYVGGLHKWQRIYESLNIYQLVKNNNSCCKMLLLIQGDSAEIEAYCSVNKIEDVKVLKNVDFKDVYRYISISDFAWLLRDNIVLNQVASPTKLGEYLACGQVIITTRVAENWSWLSNLKQHLLIVDLDDISTSSSVITNYIKTGQIGNPLIKSQIRSIAINNLSCQHDYHSLDKNILLP